MLAGMKRRVSVEDWARLKFDPAGAPQQREVSMQDFGEILTGNLATARP